MGKYRPGDKQAAKLRQNQRYATMARLKRKHSNFQREFPAGVVSAPIKRNDPETEALILEALQRMHEESVSSR